jgi:uncharacterized YigZ family protein
MLFSDSFFTVNHPSEGIYKDRGSKFLAFVFPVTTPQEIKEKLEYLKKEHPSAVHHCYAWRLGADKSAFRTNDDGEPSGTAGKPIYSQVLSNDLSNVLIVVVRYFGGSLLGVPGLIAAYKSAAADALTNNEIVEQHILEEYSIAFGEEDISRVMQLLKSHEADIVSQNYDTQHLLVYRVKKQLALPLEEKLKALYKTKLSYLQTI